MSKGDDQVWIAQHLGLSTGAQGMSTITREHLELAALAAGIKADKSKTSGGGSDNDGTGADTYSNWLRAAYLYYVTPGEDTGMSDAMWDALSRKYFQERDQMTQPEHAPLHRDEFTGGSLFWLRRDEYPLGGRREDEETRLVVAHYKAEFARLAALANNCARSPSTDPAGFRADLEALVLHAQRFLAA